MIPVQQINSRPIPCMISKVLQVKARQGMNIIALFNLRIATCFKALPNNGCLYYMSAVLMGILIIISDNISLNE